MFPEHASQELGKKRPAHLSAAGTLAKLVKKPGRNDTIRK
jgi:hypothetical protein